MKRISMIYGSIDHVQSSQVLQYLTIEEDMSKACSIEEKMREKVLEALFLLGQCLSFVSNCTVNETFRDRMIRYTILLKLGGVCTQSSRK
ncbi:hypothetical protein CEXT_264261 [Caerostris extrusa]|uniref:Uncharacterized protein n=1 Tax=Caerostris extrusa TaxID=172846 RepID=A0AAV4Q068_CAEEX|nr:hypothetical protein CEXT_264261 [Caerostris extrusa]